MARPKTPQVARILKEKRLKLGLTQGEVAKHLGLGSPQFVYMMEKNISNIPHAMLKPWTKLLKLSREEKEEIVRLEVEAHTSSFRKSLGI